MKLDSKYDDLHAVYESNTMSRADFYVLAGYVALEKASDHAVNDANKFTIKPKYGRDECSLSPNEDQTDETFPNANWNLPGIDLL